MYCGSPELPHKIPQVKKDSKFLSRLLSEESSIYNPSFRVYYGGVSSSVPFVWESQPGTPKHVLSQNAPPPLTPPPSYYTNASKNPVKKHSRSNLLRTFFPNLSLKKTFLPPSSPSSLSFTSSAWSSSDFSSFAHKDYHGRRRFWSSGSSFDSKTEVDIEEHDMGSPTSTLCFGICRSTRSGSRKMQHRVSTKKFLPA